MYRIGAFAQITGVTTKALYIYERHGLLSPQRSAAGYRRYSRRDLRRIQRIIALKSLGFPLKQIAAVLRDGTRLSAMCARQRQALGDERERIDRAIRALDAIAQNGAPGDALERFVGESTWARAEAKRDMFPAPAGRAPDRVSPSKLELFRDIEAALDRGPDGETSRQLLTRWDAMLQSETGGDADTITAMQKAWANWRNWPDGMRRYVASLYATEPAAVERVAAFIAASRA